VIAPNKHDILRHHGAGLEGTRFVYAVQAEPLGLCDAIFSALPLVRPDEPVLVGLPDTIWFPTTGLAALPADELAFLLFPVDRPQLFDAVLTDEGGRVREIRVKAERPETRWVWGAFAMPGTVFQALHRLWLRRERQDEYLGTLVNAHLAEGGRAVGVKAGQVYVDVGTLDGYQRAIELVRRRRLDDSQATMPPPWPLADAQPAMFTKAGE
jgi:dTDP-glucose pyrophosphorylase